MRVVKIPTLKSIKIGSENNDERNLISDPWNYSQTASVLKPPLAGLSW